MKDIELIRSSDTTYDWLFDGLDVCTCNGDSALRNSIIHVLKLRPYELEQKLYLDKGSPVNNMVGVKPSENVTEMIQESISNSINELDGVRSTQVTVENTAGEYMIKELVVTTTDGREVTISGI